MAVNWIVQKYGGTSLGNGERLINVAKIIEEWSSNKPVAVVVSALSSYTKSEGTTSRLIEAGQCALHNGNYDEILTAIENTHFEALEEAITSPSLKEETKELIHEELRTLRSFLGAIKVIQEISPRSDDMIVGTGERLSAMLLAGVLKDRGMESQAIDLSNLYPESEDSRVPGFYNKTQKLIKEACNLGSGMIPVVTGYFGFVKGGIVQIIGRGYTDLTAAMLAAEIGAEELQVWKEVDGIYSADPRKVNKATVLAEISPAEAAELTYFGSQVLHPFTMERAMQANVPIRIKNTFDPSVPGTVIRHKEPQSEYDKRKRPAVAVTTKEHIYVLNIHSNRTLHSSRFLGEVFNIFKEREIVLDLISTSEVSLSCALEEQSNLENLVEDLKAFGVVDLEDDKAILSLVGEGMQAVPGVASKYFNCLAKNGINIEMISQGASEINITCVIDQKDARNALQALHREFLE